ncbi:VOC family protein [Kutzneria kofuensis]|uniref:Glyoxalase-like domain-containing protein n=1 Tax=Kutzneria kofuensis TaxID=103725 RepID=A0A7W9KNV9_9PSEU|nr:VOC family protein [Kutzneria kofuensis]MBB5896040.1 hypothetical protein [Kutzneria kofuensis]
MDNALTAAQFQASDGVGDWRVLTSGASAWFDAPSHAAGAGLVRRAAGVAEIDLRADGVRVHVGSVPLTPVDVAVARAISGVAAELGLAANPAVLQTVQLTIDALDPAAVMPFWRDALGYEPEGDEDLVDPLRRDPGIWFQRQDHPRPLRNRLHVDVARPDALAATPAGQQRRRNEFYATLADAEGNEADIIPADPLGEAEDWRVLFGAMAFYPTESPAELVEAVADLADEAGLPLLVDLRPGGVTIDTGKDRWTDKRFPDLARRIQRAARDLGLTADPARLRFVQFGIDAVDVPQVRDFWRAVLGYDCDPRPGVTDIYDPRRLNPPIFFQPMDESEHARRRQRNRMHLDLFVPDDRAHARVEAGLAAGGRIVHDKRAPFWWTLADPEGNELDIAVTVGRE